MSSINSDSLGGFQTGFNSENIRAARRKQQLIEMNNANKETIKANSAKKGFYLEKHNRMRSENNPIRF